MAPTMKDYLEAQLKAVLAQFDDVPADFSLEFQQPNNPEHGDLASNAALKLARYLRRKPRDIAEDLAARLRALPLDENRVASIEIAGPGFMNFRFSDRYLYNELAAILAAGDAYGRSEMGAGKTALVEYVSANPTGPLTVGHGRNAVLGDTIANLLDWAGYDVTREYYFNNAGRQMRVLGESVRARYRELVRPGGPTKTLESGLVVPEDFPEDGYQGDYIIDIAQVLVNEHGEALADTAEVDVFKAAAEKAMFADIDKTMRRMGIHMETYYNEQSLYTSNKLWDALDAMREKGFVYDQDGAVWFKTTAFGKDKDTVLVKSTGEPTYRLPDIAYHADKLDRGFDLAVDIFGADHIATYPDVLKGIEVLGYDPSKVEVVIYQFVTLMRGGELVKMSTRKATFITLDELMDEVTPDVTRFFFLMRAPSTHLEFDLDLAKDTSDKNPVFYLQYAHARICSIMRKAEEVGFTFGEEADLTLLTHTSEIDLIKVLLDFPSVIERTATNKGPHRLAGYLREVATAFNQFYRDCHIIGEPEALATARMHLAEAARLTLRNGLTILGLSAPERM